MKSFWVSLSLKLLITGGFCHVTYDISSDRPDFVLGSKDRITVKLCRPGRECDLVMRRFSSVLPQDTRSTVLCP